MRLSRKSNPAPDEKLAFEYAKSAVTEFGAWIKNADTKATVLAAGFGAVSTITAGRASAVLAVIADAAEGWRTAVAVIAVTLVVASIATLWFLIKALVPRREISGGRNAFAWPSVAASFTPDDETFDAASSVMAWRQAHALAYIAREKFAAFESALFSFVAVIVCAALIVGVASTAAPAA